MARMAGTWTWLLPGAFIGLGSLALFASFKAGE
jgi:hypothetical protein